MEQPDTRQPAPLDVEPLVAAAQAAIGVSKKLLDLIGTGDGSPAFIPNAGLEEIAADLAEVLRDVFDFMPRWSDEDTQLFGALEKWL